MKYLYNGRKLIKLPSKIFGFGIQNLPKKIHVSDKFNFFPQHTCATSGMHDQLQLRVTMSNRCCWSWYRLCSYNRITASHSTCFVVFCFECWCGESVLETFLFKFLHSTHLTPFVDLSKEICILSTSVHYFTRNITVDGYEHPSGFRSLNSLKWLDRPCLRLLLCLQI